MANEYLINCCRYQHETEEFVHYFNIREFRSVQCVMGAQVDELSEHKPDEKAAASISMIEPHLRLYLRRLVCYL